MESRLGEEATELNFRCVNFELLKGGIFKYTSLEIKKEIMY